MNVGDESNKVTNSRIKDTEAGCGISLRVRRVRKISDRFQTDHGGDFVATRFASASVNKTSHLLTQKIRRFLVHKCDEAQRALCRCLSETACQREHRSNAAAIVIGAGRSEDRVVMRADKKNFGASTANFRLDVVTSSSVQIVCVAPRMQPSAGKRILDKIRGGVELRIPRHVSLADFG